MCCFILALPGSGGDWEVMMLADELEKREREKEREDARRHLYPTTLRDLEEVRYNLFNVGFRDYTALCIWIATRNSVLWVQLIFAHGTMYGVIFVKNRDRDADYSFVYASL